MMVETKQMKPSLGILTPMADAQLAVRRMLSVVEDGDEDEEAGNWNHKPPMEDMVVRLNTA